MPARGATHHEMRAALDRLGDVAGRSIVLESWDRSRHAGVQRDAPPAFREVSSDELTARQLANQELLVVVVPHLQWLSRWAADRGGVAYVVDRDGIVLHSEGDAEAVRQFRLSPGFDWSERQMGTNGAGTALAAARPVAIVGCDHWSFAWADATCLAAPIVNGAGDVIGAIDVSTPMRPGDAERLVTTTYVAHAASQELARREAERDRRMNDRTLAVIAHELRQPLSAVALALRLMNERAGGQEAGARAREVAERQMHHFARLVDDLWQGARMKAGKIDLHPERLDLGHVIRDVVELLTPTFTDRPHEVAVQLPSDPLWVTGDRMRLHQVFSNLLQNAAKYSPAGTPITIRGEQEPDGRIVIRVIDRGIGLAPDMLPRVFEPYAQASSSDGLGIGLVVARSIVERHGGTIEAHSAGIGLGAEFVVTMPGAV